MYRIDEYNFSLIKMTWFIIDNVLVAYEMILYMRQERTEKLGFVFAT